jgi:hypothetical protein
MDHPSKPETSRATGDSPVCRRPVVTRGSCCLLSALLVLGLLRLGCSTHEQAGADPQVEGASAQSNSRKPAASLLDGVMVYLTFEPDSVVEEEGLQIVRDLSGGGNHGLLCGAKLTQEGKVGGAVEFSGADFVVLPDLIATTYEKMDAFTLSVWLRESSYPEQSVVFQGWTYVASPKSGSPVKGFSLVRYGKGRRYKFESPWNYDEHSVKDVPAGEWHHLAGVCSRADGAIRIFLDGKAVQSERYHWGALRPSEDDLKLMQARIGSHIRYRDPMAGGGDYYCGKVDEFLLFSRALTDEEVASLYQMGIEGRRPDPPVSDPPVDSLLRPDRIEDLKDTVNPGWREGIDLAPAYRGGHMDLDEYRKLVKTGKWRAFMSAATPFGAINPKERQSRGEARGFAGREDGTMIVYGTTSGVIELRSRNCETQEFGIQQMYGQPEGCSVRRLDFSPDDVWMACSGQSSLVLVDPIGRDRSFQEKAARYLDTGLAEVGALAFSPNSQSILCGGRASEQKPAASVLQLHPLNPEGEARHFETTYEEVTAVAFSPDGSQILAATGDHLIRLMDAASGNELRVLRGHTGPITDVVFLSDGKHAVSASEDTTVRVWDVVAGVEQRVLRGHTEPVVDVDVASDGRLCISAGLDGVCQLWHLPSGREIEHFIKGRAPAEGVVWVGEGRSAAVLYRDGGIREWAIPIAAGLFWPSQDAPGQPGQDEPHAVEPNPPGQ